MEASQKTDMSFAEIDIYINYEREEISVRCLIDSFI